MSTTTKPASQPGKIKQTHDRAQDVLRSDGHPEDASGAPQIIAVGRMSKLHRRDEAELAVLIHDGFQHLGLGTELYRRLIAVARDEQLRRLRSTVLSENHEMRAICQTLGFRLHAALEHGTIRDELDL